MGTHTHTPAGEGAHSSHPDIPRPNGGLITQVGSSAASSNH